MSSFVVTSWLCPSFKSEGVTQTGGVESDGSLTQAPGQQARLGWTGKTGWCHKILPRVAVAIFGVSCSTYSHSSQSKEALGPGQGQWEESPIPLQGGSGCQPLALNQPPAPHREARSWGRGGLTSPQQ